MKAILVIDMPTDCNECPCFYEEAYRCKLHTEIDEDLYHGKPSWCPLKPMPMKKASLEKWFAEGGTYLHTYNPNDYDKGWNDCIDFLEGDMQND